MDVALAASGTSNVLMSCSAIVCFSGGPSMTMEFAYGSDAMRTGSSRAVDPEE